MLKVMLDTNAFDFIYDKSLIDKVQNAVDNGSLPAIRNRCTTTGNRKDSK
jgi:hypothetical protein